MQRLVALALLACLAASILCQAAVAKDPPAQPPAAKPTAARPTEAVKNEFLVGDPVRYKNLTIFPVSSRVPRNENRFLTLDEGLKARTVQVFEVGSQPPAAQGAAQQPAANQPSAHQARRSAPARQTDNADPFGSSEGDGPDVNRLVVLNKSDKPLYLMPGEVIYGGQQDRTIAVEAIIPPGKKPVAIDVFCVEQGRWAANGVAETTTAIDRLSAASPEPLDAKSREKLAEEAKHGKFVAHAGSLPKAGRVAVQEARNQEEVWNKVGQANGAAANQSPSSDFVACYTDPKTAKQLQAYFDAAQASVANRKQVVGAIVAVNGTVEAVDVFQSTPLFQKLWPKLLKGHALDALAGTDEKEAKKQATVDDARKFLDAAMRAGVAKKSDSPGGLVVTKRDSEKVMSFSAGLGGMGGMGGGFGDADAVHSSGYKK
jgi:hypothetical protein